MYPILESISRVLDKGHYFLKIEFDGKEALVKINSFDVDKELTKDNKELILKMSYDVYDLKFKEIHIYDEEKEHFEGYINKVFMDSLAYFTDPLVITKQD